MARRVRLGRARSANERDATAAVLLMHMHRGPCTALFRAVGPSPRDGHRGCVPRVPARPSAGWSVSRYVEECVDATVVCVAPMAHGTAVIYSTPDHLFDNDKHDELSYPPAATLLPSLVSQNALSRPLRCENGSAHVPLRGLPPLASRTSPLPRLSEPSSLQCCTIFVVAGRPLSFSGPSMWQYLHLNSLRPLSLKIFLGSVLMPTHPSIMSTSSSESSQIPSGR